MSANNQWGIPAVIAHFRIFQQLQILQRFNNTFPYPVVMSPENLEKYNAMVARINAMSKEELDKLIAEDRCPFEPEHMIGVPMGMFHCELCSHMCLAGVSHPRQSSLDSYSDLDIDPPSDPSKGYDIEIAPGDGSPIIG